MRTPANIRQWECYWGDPPLGEPIYVKTPFKADYKAAAKVAFLIKAKDYVHMGHICTAYLSGGEPGEGSIKNILFPITVLDHGEHKVAMISMKISAYKLSETHSHKHSFQKLLRTAFEKYDKRAAREN